MKHPWVKFANENRTSRVPSVYHGLSGTKRERLVLKGFRCSRMVRVIIRNGTCTSLKSLAIPAGFEPATHGVEIRSGPSNVNHLGAPCTIGVPSSPEKSKFHAFGRALVGLSIGK